MVAQLSPEIYRQCPAEISRGQRSAMSTSRLELLIPQPETMRSDQLQQIDCTTGHIDQQVDLCFAHRPEDTR